MTDTQQQIADGARPLARVGDVIAHGEAIPANVREVSDASSVNGWGRWVRSVNGRWNWAIDARGVERAELSEGGLTEDVITDPESDCAPYRVEAVSYNRPPGVVEADPEPQPAESATERRERVSAELHARALGEVAPNGLVEHRCPIGDPHGPHMHRGFAAPEGLPPLWCPGRVATPSTDPGTFAECVAWLIDAGLGGNADRRIDRMAAQHQELQARYDTVVSDRETVRGSLELVKQRIREERQEPAESGPITLSLPQVPDGAVALVGGKSGKRWVPINRRTTWQVEGTTEAVADIGLLLYREGSVTVEFAPPREPRTWERFPELTPEELTALPWAVDVILANGAAMRWTCPEDSIFFEHDDSQPRTLLSLRELGEVREVIEP